MVIGAENTIDDSGDKPKRRSDLTFWCAFYTFIIFIIMAISFVVSGLVLIAAKSISKLMERFQSMPQRQH